MDVEKVFHMTGGVGNTSYAQNSSLQKAAADKAKHITLETVEELYTKTSPKSVGIADLGCSSGPNTLSIIKEIVEAIEGTSRKILLPSPECRVYLNDLPTNDFNAIFKALPEFYKELRRGERQALHGGPSVYIAGYPGSFYGRLFPDKCLHLIYSSYSLHWLSRVPSALYDSQGRSINKESIYITQCSPPEVSLAYHRQFQEDFSLFLRSRSEEVISGGRMVLILLGRRGKNHVDRGNAFFWELLSQSVKKLACQGEVELEKLDSYDVHFYAPSKDEIEEEVKNEGSFALDRLEMLEMDKDARHYATYGTAVSMAVRAIQESMISNHFGEGILDSLFKHFGTLVDEEVAKEDIKGITLVIVLRKV